MDTKQCPYCDAQVGTSEEKCPKCGFDFSQFDEETISNFEKISDIVAKKREKARKAREEEERRNQPPSAPPKKKGFFDSLKGK